MDKVQSSFAILFLFLMEFPLHLCLPYAGEFKPAGQTTRLMGYMQSQRPTNVTQKPTLYAKEFQLSHVQGAFSKHRAPARTTPTPFPGRTDNGRSGTPESTKSIQGFVAHSVGLNTNPNTGDTGSSPDPGRSHMPQSKYLFNDPLPSLGLGGKIVLLNLPILSSSRLVQAEEKQQLASLYKNVKIPLLGDEEEGSEDEGQDESTHLLPESEKELEKFIHSVIRSKRRKRMEKKRLNTEQKLVKEVEIRDAIHTANPGRP
ncbi:uncharacterized protein C19orf18 homolog [Phocoena sinus]|uniref:uncharacterized protein C19orf18 homolog n=1 Tax=Phocoena sinus TaxID=42100 RepID=UPI0013C518A8|nr:uncharacterized protein C19orf18 homolog [Phocoena sinus]